MTAELRNLLSGWNELWRYPALITALGQSGDVTPEAAVAGLLAGIASCHDAQSAVTEVIDQGDFVGAETILKMLSAAADPPSELELESLGQRLAVARERFLDEVRARAAHLARRAKEVDQPVNQPPDLEELAARRRTAAVARLDEWERRISEPEGAVTKALRERLAASESTSPAEWVRAVRRCIDARAFSVAEQLLRTGPGAASPDTPTAVPPRKPWPYADSPTDVINWFLRVSPAPGDFHRDWGSDDPVVRRVLESLRRIVARGVKVERVGGVERKCYPGVDEQSVRDFADALDTALGSTAGTTRTVLARDDGYETTLAGLVDPRAPWLPLGPGGVRVWVCRLAEPTVSVGAGNGPLPVGFPLPLQRMPHLLTFDYTALFRALGDRERLRVHLLRELGMRVALTKAVPSSVPASFESGDLRLNVDWFLDLLGVPLAGSEIVDLLIYHSAGRAAVLLPLLAAVFDSLPTRFSAISAETVAVAARSDGFLKKAAQALLTALGEDASAKATLAAVCLAAGRPGSAVNLDLVVFACKELAGSPPPLDLQDHFTKLSKLGLIIPHLTENSYELPVAGIGPVLMETFPEAVAIGVIRATWGAMK